MAFGNGWEFFIFLFSIRIIQIYTQGNSNDNNTKLWKKKIVLSKQCFTPFSHFDIQGK